MNYDDIIKSSVRWDYIYDGTELGGALAGLGDGDVNPDIELFYMNPALDTPEKVYSFYYLDGNNYKINYDSPTGEFLIEELVALPDRRTFPNWASKITSDDGAFAVGIVISSNKYVRVYSGAPGTIVQESEINVTSLFNTFATPYVTINDDSTYIAVQGMHPTNTSWSIVRFWDITNKASPVSDGFVLSTTGWLTVVPVPDTNRFLLRGSSFTAYDPATKANTPLVDIFADTEYLSITQTATKTFVVVNGNDSGDNDEWKLYAQELDTTGWSLTGPVRDILAESDFSTYDYLNQQGLGRTEAWVMDTKTGFIPGDLGVGFYPLWTDDDHYIVPVIDIKDSSSELLWIADTRLMKDAGWPSWHLDNVDGHNSTYIIDSRTQIYMPDRDNMCLMASDNIHLLAATLVPFQEAASFWEQLSTYTSQGAS